MTRLAVGQRVSVEPGVPDFTCEQCLAGRYNLCEDMRFYATPPIDGAFAELVTVHEQFAHPVPDTLSDDAAALLEPLSVGFWACRKGEVGAGTRVLVTGAGPVGLVAMQAALALGAASVTVTDVNPHRLALAVSSAPPTRSTCPRPRSPRRGCRSTCCWSARVTRRPPRTRSGRWHRPAGSSSSAWEATR